VSKRKLKERRAETIYFLSPKFSKLCSKTISYLEMVFMKRDLNSIEKEVYRYITGKDSLE
jgi:hypothetical protein